MAINEALVLKNKMSYEELCKLADETKGFKYEEEVRFGELIIYSLADFLDVLEDDLNATEAANASWKLKNARTPGGISPTEGVRCEKQLKALWNYFNNEAYVPSDIGICFIKRGNAAFNQIGTVTHSLIAVFDKCKVTSKAGRIAMYHNRTTNKCKAKVVDYECIPVTYIQTYYQSGSSAKFGVSFYGPVDWVMHKENAAGSPDTDPSLGVKVNEYTYAEVKAYNKAITSGGVTAGDVYLKQLENKAEAFICSKAEKSYCPICGEDCYVSGGYAGCNKHAILFSDMKTLICEGSTDYRYIDYVGGKFLIRKICDRDTVAYCPSGSLYDLYTAWQLLYGNQHSRQGSIQIKRCKQCGGNFVITEAYALHLEQHGYKVPCCCAKCRGKSQGLWGKEFHVRLGKYVLPRI